MTPDTLLAGPRGRRVLLEFVLLCEEAAAEPADAARPGERALPLRSAVFKAAHHLGEQTGVTYMSFSSSPGPGNADANAADSADLTDISVGAYGRDYPEVMPPDVVARLVRDTPLDEPTPELLDAALDMSVGSAMYWQPPHGEDVLASCPVVVAALRDAAELVAASPHVEWWDGPVSPDALDDQWTVSWSDQPGSPATGALECPGQHRRSNEWWSFPDGRSGRTVTGGGTQVLSSTRSLSNGSLPDGTQSGGTREVPAGLLFVEDQFSDSAWVRKLHMPQVGVGGAGGEHGAVRDIYEITGPDDWADLCRCFPLYVTAAVVREWADTTGLHSPDQRWVMPDWAAVSRHYDGAHLSVAGYLTAATRAIHLDGRTASVIAGWGPDSTYWFAPVREEATVTRWELDDDRRWQPVSS
ncbi:MAG: hypothetical protein ACTHY6_12985 [Corynebacterium variabile]|uniref:hypothetical protein n=1 Tax=Corynebacterium variabile TaxID=1727 RepID=UPI003F9013F1